MLTNISWTDYLIGASLLLAIYYLFVGVRYFSADIKKLISGKRKMQLSGPLPDDGAADDLLVLDEDRLGISPFETIPDGEFDAVEHLIGRIKTVAADASRNQPAPEELKYQLSQALGKYPSLRHSPLCSSINELILSECQKYGLTALNEEEVKLLWSEAV